MENIKTFEKYHGTCTEIRLCESSEICSCGNYATHTIESSDCDEKNFCDECYKEWWAKAYTESANSIEFEVTPIKED